MRLALDLAYNDAAAILADPAGAQRAAVRHGIAREAMNREGTPAAWRVLVDAAREAMAQCGVGAADISAVALAFPARLQHGVVQRGLETDGWLGFVPAAALAQTFGFAPQSVSAYPRVLCAAQGEATYGALQNKESWLYLSLDRAFDAAVCEKGGGALEGHAQGGGHAGGGPGGALAGGAAGTAGAGGGGVSGGTVRAIDLGHVCLDRDGIVGPGGRRGELQAYCGADNLEARAAGYGLTHRSAAQIWALASSNAAAQSLCEDYARRLAQGIAVARACFAFETVCLGGHLAVEAGASLLPLLQHSLGEFCEVPETVTAQLGRDDAIFGALALTAPGFSATGLAAPAANPHAAG